jgi:hypothetical protein
VSSVRIHNFSISLDGYSAGPRQDTANALGARGLEVHRWMHATRRFREMSDRISCELTEHIQGEKARDVREQAPELRLWDRGSLR